jgi:hypothetical protein
MPNNGWYGGWLNENPQAVYHNWANTGMRTPAMSNWFGNNYNKLFNQYQGVQAGGNPMAVPSFQNWLNSLNANQYYQNQPNYTRGMNYGAFSPSRRWLIY